TIHERPLEDGSWSRYGEDDDPLSGAPRVLAGGGARVTARAAHAGSLTGARLPPVSAGMPDARAASRMSPRSGDAVSSERLLQRHAQRVPPRSRSGDAVGQRARRDPGGRPLDRRLRPP